jgi:quercetin dioxygenase-like cupin family protein
MDETSAVIRLDELVQYQEGSIVSRKLTAASGGNITVFAFGEGEELSEHTTPHTALVQVLDGRAEIRIAQQLHTVRAGESLVLPPGVPHALKAVERFKMSLTMLRAQV